MTVFPGSTFCSVYACSGLGLGRRGRSEQERDGGQHEGEAGSAHGLLS
jgi:hypothetical protein